MFNDVKTPWKLTALVVLIVVVAFAFFTTLAKAHEITKIDNDAVLIKGEFKSGLTQQMRLYMDSNPQTTMVILNSNGGLFSEGILLGQLFNELKLGAAVVEGDRCVSACAFAFLGGERQIVEGVLAFHRAWTDDREMSMNQVFADGQQIGGYMTWYIMSMGYNTQLAYFIQAKTSRNTYLVFKNKEDLDRMFVSMKPDTPVTKFLLPTGVSAEWMKDHLKAGGAL